MHSSHTLGGTVLTDFAVTVWLQDLRAGDDRAATRLWEFLHARMERVALNQIVARQPTGYDEEDVALSAFDAFCRAIQQGQYSGIDDRGELWQLLAVITLNKARNRARDESRMRRGGGVDHQPISNGITNTVASSDDDPALAALMQDECQRLLSQLDREEVQLVALLKVEGYTNEEIADRLGCTRRSVHRRLALIRQVWAKEVE